MSEYITASERAKVIKQGLKKQFSDVSVKKGTGTASSWVSAYVTINRPVDCACEWSGTYWNGTKAPKPFRSTQYCQSCKNAYNTTSEIATKLSYQAMKDANYEHSTYYSDDGYNTPRDEFMLQVEVA